MRAWQGKKYWLVGASDGIGRALAMQLSRAGAEVIVSARGEDKLLDLVASLPGRSRHVVMDVTDAESVRQAAELVGPVDGLVYLAGAFQGMGAQDFDGDAAARILDVNLGGAMRVVGAVLPQMLAKDDGHIVLTGALCARSGFPGDLAFSAGKAGLLHFSRSLDAELRDTKVVLRVVEPGFVHTATTAQNTFGMPFALGPESAGREYFEAMNDDSFYRSFPVQMSWLARLGACLPRRLWTQIFPLFKGR